MDRFVTPMHVRCWGCKRFLQNLVAGRMYERVYMLSRWGRSGGSDVRSICERHTANHFRDEEGLGGVDWETSVIQRRAFS